MFHVNMYVSYQYAASITIVTMETIYLRGDYDNMFTAHNTTLHMLCNASTG